VTGLRTALVMTLTTWIVAFGIVTALLSLFGRQLMALPLAPRAAVISGVMVTLMVNVAMPRLRAVIARVRQIPVGCRLFECHSLPVWA
jgi:antibiotic biosynthesis monooxygenase (ABM) superfamily enzyme